MNWRTFGDVPYPIWQLVITQAGGPDGLASMAAWDAAKPHSALALAMMGVESRYGTTFSMAKPEQKNALGISSGGKVLTFPAWPDGLAEWRRRLSDPTYKGGVYAKTVTLPDLIGVYAPASDPRNNQAAYVAKVRTQLASWGIVEELEANVEVVEFGKVPHPAFDVRDIGGAVNTAWDNLGPRKIRGVVWHRMEGSLWGTDAYFRTGGENGGAARARTDYGIGVLAMDGSANAGRILRWTDPRSTISPWANGRVSAEWGDGKAFMAQFPTRSEGLRAVNRDLVSIEISGQGTTALDSQSRLAIAALTAYWADQASIPWESFPQVPNENRSFVIWHREFTEGTGKTCPYAVVQGETNAIIEQAKAIMKQYQTQAVAPAPVKPMPIDQDKLAALIDGGQLVRVPAAPLTATEDTVPRQYADARSAVITSLPAVPKGKTITPQFAVVGADGRLWYVSDTFARYEAKAFG